MPIALYESYCTNLVGIPTRFLASPEFVDDPAPLSIAGVRAMYPALFEMLALAETPDEAAAAFHSFCAAIFGLDAEQWLIGDGKSRQYRSNYLRLLKGWGYDSNSPEGAVLKGWVESRFGLFPTFHRQPLVRYGSQAWMSYVVEKMSSRFHNNSIHTQLDLLYEFCQWMLPRFFIGDRSGLTLYRGINDFDEHMLVKKIDKNTAIMRLNNLSSFSDDREIASEFGDIILTVRVPAVKILFFSRLVPRHGLKGEAEYLVIGGDYRVEHAYL